MIGSLQAACRRRQLLSFGDLARKDVCFLSDMIKLDGKDVGFDVTRLFTKI